MYPGTYAAEAPDRAAAVMAGTGETLSYGDLERRSVQLAHVLHEAGLRPGDVVALLTENNLRAFEVYWAAMRSGLYITAVNWHLKPDEIAYIVNDSGATALIVSAEQAPAAEAIAGLTTGVKLRLAFGGPVKGYGGYEDTIAAASDEPFADQPNGSTMLYSSGTTGRPKGVRPSLPDRQVTEPGDALAGLASMFFGVNQDSVYLSPGPIYHAAPLRWCGSIQVLGGTVVMTKRFDAEQVLAAIEDHHVTHAQFVPTMFVRMLQLPQDTRDRYDVSSLRVAIHAAAPCPVEVKQKMIAWWGPVLFEYYAGTEGNGMTAIDSATWLTKPGTVGRAISGTVRICADDGTELPGGPDRRRLLRERRGPVRLPQRPGQDPGRPAPGPPQLDHPRRHRLPRRGRLPVPHRPQGVHDHLRRRQHLPAGNRERARAAPGRLRRRGHRRARPGDGGVGGRVRPARPRRRPGTRTRAGDHRVREVEDRRLQGAQDRPLRRQPAAQRGGQADEG